MNIKTFTDNLFGELHIITDFDENATSIGELFFSGNEVASALGYVKVGDAIAQHVPEEDRKTLKYKAFGKTQKAELAFLWSKVNDFSNKTIINEAGLYALILGSELESSKEFKHWVTHEVLPSIRANGGYILGQEDMPEDIQDKIHEVTRELEAEISEVKDKLAQKNRLHKAAVAERNQLRDDKKHLKSELKAWKAEVDDLESQYGRVLSDLADAQVRLRALRLKMNKPAEAEPENIIKKILVDSQGFLV